MVTCSDDQMVSDLVGHLDAWTVFHSVTEMAHSRENDSATLMASSSVIPMDRRFARGSDPPTDS